jgi:hypothetical protein
MLIIYIVEKVPDCSMKTICTIIVFGIQYLFFSEFPQPFDNVQIRVICR